MSQTLSDSDFRVLNHWTRYLAMLDVPTPKWAIVRWMCNRFNLVEAWYRWEQAGRMATAMQQMPKPLFEIAINILKQVNQ